MTQQGSNAKRASSTGNRWLACIVIQNIASFPLGIIFCEACARHQSETFYYEPRLTSWLSRHLHSGALLCNYSL